MSVTRARLRQARSPALAPPAPNSSRRRIPTWAVVAVVLIPIAVAAGDVIFGPTWHPATDFALIELHTRDIGSHWVLTGAWSRFHWNHPGPALYYLLVVPYRLLGSRFSGLEIGSLLLNAGCVAGALVIARRRGGLACAVIAGALILALLRTLGDITRSPWNADIPVLGLLLLMFVVWTITRGDFALLPLAFGVGSAVVQTHVGYALLVGSLLVWAVMGALLCRRETARGGGSTRSLRNPLVWSAVVLVVFWILPVGDELFGDGNLSRLFRFFTAGHSGQALHATVGLVSTELSIWPEWVASARHTAFFTGASYSGSIAVPVALIGTVVALVVAWRRSPDVRNLAITVIVAVAAATISVLEITGPLFPYLTRFTWVVGLGAWLVTIWGLAELFGWLQGRRSVIAITIALAVSVCLVVIDSIDQAEVSPPAYSAQIAQLMTPAVRDAITPGQPVYVGPLRSDGKGPTGNWNSFILGPGVTDVVEHWGFRAQTPLGFGWAYGPERSIGSRGAATRLLVVGDDAVAAVTAATGCRPFSTAPDAALFVAHMKTTAGGRQVRCVSSPAA